MERVDMDKLGLFESRLSVEEMSQEDISYIGFDGQRKEHSCEHLMNGFEANFCDNNLFFLTAVDSKEHGGWTYCCSRHLPQSSLAFMADIEKRRLDRDFDVWSDKQAEAERKRIENAHKACIITNVCTCGKSEEEEEEEVEISFSTCRVCLCDTSEHNWEIHTQELRAGNHSSW